MDGACPPWRGLSAVVDSARRELLQGRGFIARIQSFHSHVGIDESISRVARICQTIAIPAVLGLPSGNRPQDCGNTAAGPAGEPPLTGPCVLVRGRMSFASAFCSHQSTGQRINSPSTKNRKPPSR